MKNIIISLSIILIIDVILIWSGLEFFYLNVGIILIALKIGYLYLGFGTIKVGQIGTIFLFDMPLKDLGPGPYLSLPGIISVRKEKGTDIQDELPTEPENIFRGEGIPTKGMFPPIRIKFGQPEHIQDPTKVNDPLKEDPYNIAMVAEVVPIVSWRIHSGMIFFARIGTIENCRKILSDKAIEVFGDAFSNVTPAKALLTLGETSQKLEDELRKETEDWGIIINDAYVKPFIFSHQLNDAVIKVSESTQTAKSIKIIAGATKQQLIDEGACKAEALKALLEAQAIGTKKLAKICKTPEGVITLWMETMGKAFEKAQYSIVPGSELFTSVAGIKEMLDKIKGGK